MRGVCRAALILCCAGTSAWSAERGIPWARHRIDGASRGADGVKLADFNRDGRLDVVTGWEEGGIVRVCLNPGPSKARQEWPAVAIGRVSSVEDAAPVDLDGDGRIDVVSCCEAKARRIHVHWAPREPSLLENETAWKTEVLPASIDVMAWMFCVPADVDGRHGIDLIAGGKASGAAVGWLESPPNPRDVAAWGWHKLREAGWIMSLAWVDMSGDGRKDILFSDRKGAQSGCFWLENPGPASLFEPWQSHPVGGQGKEAMFLTVADLDQDGLSDVILAARPKEILIQRRTKRGGAAWESHAIALPEWSGGAKAVAAGDVDLDGQMDLVVSCEEAQGERTGVVLFSRAKGSAGPVWHARDIGGPEGVKYDLVELLDVDQDGDLDALTCEEKENLGVVWYENPARPTRTKDRF